MAEKEVVGGKAGYGRSRDESGLSRLYGCGMRKRKAQTNSSSFRPRLWSVSAPGFKSVRNKVDPLWRQSRSLLDSVISLCTIEVAITLRFTNVCFKRI